jgi:hypothetical protein
MSGEVRQRAITTQADALYGYIDPPLEAALGTVLDALTDDMLIDLLVERGALRRHCDNSRCERWLDMRPVEVD